MSGARRSWLAALAVVAIVAIAEVDAARRLSVVWDELVHLGTGLSYVEHGEIKLGPDHPPLAKLIVGGWLRALGVREGPEAAKAYALAGPVMVESARYQAQYSDAVLFHDNPSFALPATSPGGRSVLLAARLPLVAVPIIIVVVAWAWARARWGEEAGLIALVLAATSPDVLGHGIYVTTDAPVAAAMLLAGFLFDRLLAQPSPGRAAAFGAALGAALATKFTAVLLLPGLGAAAVAALVEGRSRERSRERLRAAQAPALIALAMAALVVVPCYLGANPLAGYRHGLGSVWTANVAEYEGNCLGDYRARCAWYFVAALALKTPLGTLGVLALAAWAALRSREARGSLARELALHAPAVLVLGAASAAAQLAGTRYVIPAVPFLLVSAGRVAAWARGSRARAAAVGACLAASVAATVIDHPFHASSTNLLAGDPRSVHRILDDSCQDWGQGFGALARWQRDRGVEHVSVITWIPAHPADLLAAWGVSGECTTYDTRPLFFPEPGKVYAISAHLVSRARLDDLESRRRAALAGVPAAELVLGGKELPSELVGGGFLIFDRRERR
jgi:hypothetical protein